MNNMGLTLQYHSSHEQILINSIHFTWITCLTSLKAVCQLKPLGTTSASSLIAPTLSITSIATTIPHALFHQDIAFDSSPTL